MQRLGVESIQERRDHLQNINQICFLWFLLHLFRLDWSTVAFLETIFSLRYFINIDYLKLAQMVGFEKDERIINVLLDTPKVLVRFVLTCIELLEQLNLSFDACRV